MYFHIYHGTRDENSETVTRTVARLGSENRHVPLVSGNISALWHYGVFWLVMISIFPKVTMGLVLLCVCVWGVQFCFPQTGGNVYVAAFELQSQSFIIEYLTPRRYSNSINER